MAQEEIAKLEPDDIVARQVEELEKEKKELLVGNNIELSAA